VKWSILVLTQPSRTEFLRRLMDNLAPQVAKFPDVEIVTTLFDKRFSIGKNRGMMITAASGEYVNFIDDDDLVADDYVDSIRPLMDGVDYIGFQAKYHADGVYCGKLSYHSLEYKGWFENDSGYFRDISHLNPMRKELAIAGQMERYDGTFYEDHAWADLLRFLGIVKTEHVVSKPMYFVYYRLHKDDGPGHIQKRGSANTLLSLITCHSRTAYADAQRETWIPKIPPELDYKFFLGPSERAPRADEVFLDCDDSYKGLPSKVQAVYRWALEQGYEHVSKIDDDVILIPDKFVSSGYDTCDFQGHTNYDGGRVLVPWGFCYTLSRKAMEIMVNTPLPSNNNDEAWVAYTLAAHGIVLRHESRFHLHRGKRQDFIIPTKRPLRAPPRPTPAGTETPKDGIAYAVFLHWLGFHATPDDVNIKEYYKLYKEVTQ